MRVEGGERRGADSETTDNRQGRAENGERKREGGNRYDFQLRRKTIKHGRGRFVGEPAAQGDMELNLCGCAGPTRFQQLWGHGRDGSKLGEWLMQWLEEAIDLAGSKDIRLKVLEQSDLEALWSKIGEIREVCCSFYTLSQP